MLQTICAIDYDLHLDSTYYIQSTAQLKKYMCKPSLWYPPPEPRSQAPTPGEEPGNEATTTAVV